MVAISRRCRGMICDPCGYRGRLPDLRGSSSDGYRSDRRADDGAVQAPRNRPRLIEKPCEPATFTGRVLAAPEPSPLHSST
jgi:hypothetical protein